MKRALVTGAGGFIGSWLTETLVREGWSVRAMYRYNAAGSMGWLDELPPDVAAATETMAGDVRDPFQVWGAVRGMDVVFHLAALIGIPYSYVAPASYVATNVSGTLNVLQACLEEGVERVVHTSTSETYGSAQYTPMDEAHPLVGQSPYAASKIGGDKLAESYHLSFDLPVATVRPFNTYGPRQSSRAVIPTIASQALSGREEIELGALTPVRDLTFVSDTVRGFILASQAAGAVGQVINLGQGHGVSIGELAREVIALCDSSALVVSREERLRPDKGEVMELVCDAGRARTVLGWEPRVTLREGLGRVVAFIRGDVERYKPQVYNV